jgi:hypothetical protein
METIEFEYTNSCTCVGYNMETDEEFEVDYCYGDCYDEVISDFTEITRHLFDKNETGYWKVGDIKLWNRSISGIVEAEKPADLIRAMSVDSEWIMRGTVYGDRIEYSLSHHDAPTGSSSSVYIATENEVNEVY